MKGILKLFPVAVALVALASCSNDELFSSNASSQAVDGKTMSATIEDYSGATRAAFAENKTDGKVDKRALVWTAGDSYKVYGELTTPDKYTLQNASAGKANGVFDLMTEDYNENPAFAVFPYDKIDADRANKKLTVTLSDWTYATAEVKDAGYSEGGFVSNVPMFGKIAANKPKEAKFGYMTGILRVDLQKLPKKTTRLIVVTSRPLTGTFETAFDPDGDYPEIISPVSNDTEKDNTTVINGSPINNYVLAIGTEAVSQRTNKTFFIAVPTGNKYAVFDIYAEYNMAGSTETELVAQLGNTKRLADSKSVLNWERGKVKSLSKEITVTASGSTPADLAAFLKAEWKTFPADAEINITVPKGAKNFAIDLSTPAKNVFEVPAELKDRVVNIYVQDAALAAGEGYSEGAAITIQDEDPAPIASAALRQINFVVPTKQSTPVTFTINAPETQVSLLALGDGPSETAKYGNITATHVSYGDMASEAAGLFVGDNVTTGAIAIEGSLLTDGASTVGAITNDGNYETKIKGVASTITSNKNGAITVEGKLAADNSIIKTVGAITAMGSGAVSVKNVQAVTISDGGAKETGAISIENVKGVTSFAVSNTDHANAISIKQVTTNGITSFAYAGKGAVTFDDVIGASTSVAISNTANESAFTMSNIKNGATWASVSYAGKGNVSITGVSTLTPAVYPTITALTTNTAAVPLTAGNVALKDVTIGTSLTKNSQGTLTIDGVRAAFGSITNADGAITVTGNNVSSANIASITQNGTGIVTLKEISNAVTSTGAPNSPGVVTALTVNKATTVNYENTFIKALNGNTSGDAYNVTAYGTKSSGIGTATENKASFTFTTDAWDGLSWCKVASSNVYTSGSFAGLMYFGTATNINLLVSNSTIDLASFAFQTKVGTVTYRGINTAITALNGGQYTTVGGVKIPFVVKNLKAATGLFATNTTAGGRTASLSVEYFTLDAPAITATANAGALIGIANGTGSTLKYTFRNVTVKDAVIASTSTGKGTDINLGGFVGEVNTAGDVKFANCEVATAAINGHYYMGGFVGQVTNAANVYIYGAAGAEITDKVGSSVSGITFTPISNDGTWSTNKCGTIAPFIGGIKAIASSGQLNIYGKYDTFDREANMWKMNFLSNENFKFMGTKQDDCNFIGYIDVITNPSPAWKYYLKHLNGFQANPSMTIATTGDNGKEADAILATDCNVYAKY